MSKSLEQQLRNRADALFRQTRITNPPVEVFLFELRQRLAAEADAMVAPGQPDWRHSQILRSNGLRRGECNGNGSPQKRNRQLKEDSDFQ